MTILNFPAVPSNGDVYVANGISYVYNDNAWTSNSAESNTELFVNVIGDNMTGNLTLGGDKVVLNATTGVGLFKGDVKIGGTLPASSNITLASNGSITAAGPIEVSIPNGANAVWGGKVGNTLNSQILGDGSAYFGGNSGGANIELAASGSATFAGKITSLGNAEGGAEDGATINQGSGYSASFSSDSSLLYRGYKTGNSTPTFSVAVDGTATFAGSIRSSGPDENFYSNTTLGAGNSAFRSYSGASGVSNSYHFYAGTSEGELVTISTDGSANFAGKVTSSNVTAFKNTLSSAVASASDVAELKAAIASALAQL